GLSEADRNGPYLERRGEARATGRGHEIVLLDAVPADAQPADQLTAPVQRHAAGEEDDAALVLVGRLTSLLARRRHVAHVEREERAGRRVDARRIERLGAEAARPVGAGRAERAAGEIRRDPG